MSNEALWRLILLLCIGQIVSFLLALTGFTSSHLATLRVDTPLSLSFFSYLTMALVFGSIFLYRRQKMLIPWYWYLVLAFVDVQGNYLANKAFQLTSITSVTLLDGWTIAWVIGLTWYFIGTRYSIWQLLGAAICVIGLGLLLFSDSGVAGGGGSRPLLGDMFMIVGTLFFAISNVGQEFCVRNSHLIEVVSMLGLFGTLVTVCEVYPFPKSTFEGAILERNTLQSVKWTTEIVLDFFGYTFAGFLFSALVPFLLKKSGSAMFNLSILTSDMWAVAIRILFYRQQVDWLYYVSFVIVVVGLIIYSYTAKEPCKEPRKEPQHMDKDMNEQRKMLNEEIIESRNLEASP